MGWKSETNHDLVIRVFKAIETQESHANFHFLGLKSSQYLQVNQVAFITESLELYTVIIWAFSSYD